MKPTLIVTGLFIALFTASANKLVSDTVSVGDGEISTALMLEQLTCGHVTAMTEDEISPENARVFFLRSMSCNLGSTASGGIQLQSGALGRAIEHIGAIENPFYTARVAIYFIEAAENKQSLESMAWEYVFQTALALEHPLSARDIFYVLAMLGIQMQILEPMAEGYIYQDISLKIVETKHYLKSRIGYNFDYSSNIDAFCFVKNDVGGNIVNVLSSNGFLTCVMGE